LKKILIVSIAVLILFHGCRIEKEEETISKRSPVEWSWYENQTCLTFKNIWGGARKFNGKIKVIRPISRFAFWRKSVPLGFTIRYLLPSDKGIKVFVNGKYVKDLPASSSLKTEHIRGKFFQQGINFIEIRKREGELIIDKICLDSPEKRNSEFSLEENEEVIISVEKGQAFLKFIGNGEISLLLYDSVGGLSPYKKSEIKITGELEYNLLFKSPSILRIKGLSGKVRIKNFILKEKLKRPKVRKIKFKKPFPDIYIFLIDACQAGHLGVYGYKRNTSPNIDKFARDAVVFENAYTNAAFTRASVASIFSGYYPEHHKVRVMRDSIPPGIVTLPQYLKGKGYRTSIFTASANISAKFGFKRGVDDYFTYFKSFAKKLRKDMEVEFEKWIKKTKSPKFAYLHFMEPHFPIIPPPPFRNMFKKRICKKPVILYLPGRSDFTTEEVQDVIDDYDSTIAYVDAVLGKIWDYMKIKGIYDNSLIIFISDHGEGLYEHKYFSHGREVYDEVTKIPLIVKFPSYMNLKGRVKTIVQEIDIFPTIVSMFGERRITDGRSLLEAFYQKKIGNEMAVSRNFFNPGTYGVRWRNFYYIFRLGGFKEELYDLESSPFTDISKSRISTVYYLRGRFLSWLREYQNAPILPRKVDLRRVLSKKELENLRSLGYIK